MNLNPSTFPLCQHLNVWPQPEDRVRLASPLSSWNRLSNLLSLNQFSLGDLKKMLIFEVNDRRRAIFLEKLRSRIATVETQHVKFLIDHATAPTPHDTIVPAKPNGRGLSVRPPRRQAAKAKGDVPAKTTRKKRRARRIV